MTGAVPEVRWQTSRQVLAGLALVACASTAAAVGAPVAAPGRLLLAVLAAGATAALVRSWRWRPALVADADGVRVATPRGPVRLPWSGLQARAGQVGARGVRLPVVELDDGDLLLLVPAWRLGARAQDVVAVLTARTEEPGG